MNKQKNLAHRVNGVDQDHKTKKWDFCYYKYPHQQILLDILRENDALWFHSGGVKAPHAEVEGVFCTSGYVNCSLFLNKPTITDFLATKLILSIEKSIGVRKIDWVVGPSGNGYVLAHNIARTLGAKSAFCENDEGSKTRLKWKNWQIRSNETVLQVTDKASSLEEITNIRKTIERDNPSKKFKWHPFLATVIDQLLKTDIYTFHSCDGRLVVSLLRIEILKWLSSTCPLCALGSPRIKPEENWKVLKGNTSYGVA
ncbi:MAG: hypothetical protein ACQESA_02340 [Patescibacteria group bacterium]